MTTNVEKLSDAVNSLQKDMAQVGSLVERLDVTIEKLTEVSTTVSQLLAVQGNRLEVQERVQEKLSDQIEKRRQETEHSIKEIYGKIEKVESEVQSDMDANQQKLIDKMDEMRAESQKQHNEVSERIGSIERWMWTLIGGSVIVGFIVNNSELVTSILT